MQELLKAFVLIFMAEMGDKTQILAMAFATKFPVKKVLLGIFLGSLLNHGLAVMLGSYISNFIPINTVQIVVGFAFVGFSLWNLKCGDEDEDREEKSKFGPVATVALAFFIGELGDKTQLTTITLATASPFPLAVLGGTVLGMTITGIIGIIIGKKLGDKVPEIAIKLIASSVFMFFGILKLYQNLPSEFINFKNVIIFVGILSIVFLIMLKHMIEKRQKCKNSAFNKVSRELYEYYRQAEENINKICLGPVICKECQGNSCVVGFTKNLIKSGLEETGLVKQETFISREYSINKGYSKEEVLKFWEITLEFINKHPANLEYKNIYEIKKSLEAILFKP